MVAPRQLRAGRLDTLDFRQAVSAFTTGVTVVTTCDDSGTRYGLTANSFASVSLEPPLVLFCVDHRAPSLTGLNRSRHFAINVLASDQEDIAKRFARRAEDKFAFHRSRFGTVVADSATG